MKMQLWRITHVVLVVFTVLVPSNSGLSFARERGLVYIAEKFKGYALDVQEVRGESIAARVQNAASSSIGITGEDLLEDFIAREAAGVRSREQLRMQLVLNRLNLMNQGGYSSAVFGLPALCILGKNGFSLAQFKDFLALTQDRELCTVRQPDFQGKKVAIPARYAALIRLRIDLSRAQVIPLDGQVDVTAARGDADFAIDIVLTGRTLEREGLCLFPPVLYRSDGVVIGKMIERPRVVDIDPWTRWLNTGRTFATGGQSYEGFSH